MKVAVKTKAELNKEINELRVQLKEAEKKLLTASEAKARSSEITSRSILDQATDIIIVCDEYGKIIRVSEVAHRYIGGKLLSKPFDWIVKLRFFSPHPLRKQDFSISETLRGKIFRREEVILQNEGKAFNFLLSARPLTNQAGRIHGCVVTLTDITERKHMEAELTRLASFPQLNPNPVVEVDLAGQVYYSNPAAKQLFPDLKKTALNHPWVKGLEKIRQITKPGEGRTFARELGVEDRWYQQTIHFVMDGTRLRIYGFDITERKEAEQERERLRIEAENEKRRLEAVMEALPVGVAITDAQGGNIRANSAFEQVWGSPRPAAASVSDYAAYKAWWVDSDQPVAPQEWASARAVQKGEAVVGQMLKIRRFDGSQAFIINSGAPIFDANGIIAGSAVAIHDVTAYRETEMKYSRILATALSGFWIADAQGKLLEVNEALCRMLGYTREKLLTLSIADVEADESPADVLSHIAALQQKKSDFFISRHRREDGSIIDVEINSTWLEIGEGQLVGFVRDITERKQMEEELRKSRDELEIRVQKRTKEVREQARVLDSFFKLSITPFVILDKDFNFIRVNEAYARACHRELSEFLGHNHFEFYPSDAKAKFEQVVRTKKPFVAVARPFSFPDHPEWGTTYWDWTLTPILDDNGEVEYLVFLLEDVTARKRAEEELRTAHQYNRGLIEASLDPLVTINPEGKVTDVNSATELATGVPREQLIGSDFSDYFTEPEKAREGYRTVFSKGTVRDYPLAIRHRSGMITDALYNATIFRNEAGKTEGVFAAARDITERKRAEEALKESEIRLRTLSSQLLTAQETERKRIALELHDSVGQMLTAIKFKAENILQAKEKPRAKQKSLEAVISLIKETIEEVRKMQMDLHPSTLDDLGVVATLGWFCREYQKIYSRIRIDKEIALQENEVSVPLKVVLYRLTQEAMNNIAKHSQADLVRLSLRKQQDRIEWAVEDNGVGFDFEEILSPEGSKRGLGLGSMRERTTLSGGAFAIESTKGKGTTVRASWPLS